MKLFQTTKKGQAALEFLMTYGWAFLVMIAVIAGIVALDPLSMAQNQGADTCSVTNELQCDPDRTLLDGDELTFYVTNRGSSQITISSLNVTGDEGTSTSCSGFTPPETVDRGDTLELNCGDVSSAIPGEFVEGDRYQIRGEINHYPTRLGDSYETNSDWDIRTTAR